MNIFMEQILEAKMMIDRLDITTNTIIIPYEFLGWVKEVLSNPSNEKSTITLEDGGLLLNGTVELLFGHVKKPEAGIIMSELENIGGKLYR